MKSKGIIAIGLILITISLFLMSLGYDFLMSQRPVDFAHWALLIGAILMFGLWFTLPDNITKTIGLSIMTLGIGGMIGMCTIDFILWAAHDTPEVKEQFFNVIFNTPAIKFPFLVIGPSLFYAGICIATYGLFYRFKWQVAVANLGALMIGLGHMILHNQIIPVIGGVLLFIGIMSIIRSPLSEKSDRIIESPT